MVTIIIFSIGLFILLLINYIQIIYNHIKKVKVTKELNIKNITNKEEKNDEFLKYEQPPGPLPLPIIGNLALLGKYDVPFEGFTDLSKKYGDIYSLTLGSIRCVVVNNLELIREVLNQNGKFFGGRPDFLRYNKLFGGDRNNSLALCDWSQLQQKRRNLARKHCSPRHTSLYFTKMNDVGCLEMENFIEKINIEIENCNGKDINLKPFIMQACANMFSQYMCSIRFDYDDTEFKAIVRKFDEIFWEINQGYPVDFLPWLYPFYKNHIEKLSLCATTVRRFILERVINDREQSIDLDEPDRDFTDALLKSLKEDSSLSKNTLIFMLEDFLGGHSAVGNLVMLVLANLIKNPHVIEKIHNEIAIASKNGENIITLDDMGKMPYTQATILETLRFSSSPIVPHVATENVCVSGYGINKGTVIFINNYELNTSEKYWEKPEKFLPERFLEEILPTSVAIKKELTSEESSSLSSSASLEIMENPLQRYRVKQNIPHFFPFSVGKRTCIGQNLVKCFSFILLVNILKTYDIFYTDSKPMKIYPACVALPPDTFSLKLKQRSI